jgi:hypothetical protein
MSLKGETDDPVTQDPDSFNIMKSSAVSALKAVLSVKSREKVLIVSDKSREFIMKAFIDGAKKLDLEVSSYSLPESNRPLSDIPTDLQALVEEKDICVNAFTSFAEETPFRIKLIKLETRSGARVGHAPGITKEMMVSGAMTADFTGVAKNAKLLIEAFKNARNIHITTNEGTNITLDISGRNFDTDAWITPGTMGNLPAGEIWCAPVEDKAEGTIVVNGSIGDIGNVKEILTITVKNGRISDLQSKDNDLVERIKELTSFDDLASVIGELGIGLNPKARLTGNLLEDEKAGGTAHIAFGRNDDMPGGRNTSKTHRDFLFYRPTFDVEYEDGSKRVVIRDGDVVD